MKVVIRGQNGRKTKMDAEYIAKLERLDRIDPELSKYFREMRLNCENEIRRLQDIIKSQSLIEAEKEIRMLRSALCLCHDTLHECTAKGK